MGPESGLEPDEKVRPLEAAQVLGGFNFYFLPSEVVGLRAVWLSWAYPELWLCGSFSLGTAFLT